MALSCGAKCAKWILFFFNLLLWGTGAALLSIGIWLLAAHDSATYYLNIANLDYGPIKASAIIIIVVGSLVFLLGGLGCCGACMENTTCLTAFSGFLILLLILQLVAVILAGVLNRQLFHSLGKEMAVVMRSHYGQYKYRYQTEAWNYMQINMKCCGVKENFGPLGWKNNTYWANNNKTTTQTVPDSCCVDLQNKKNYSHPVAVKPAQCYNAAVNITLSDKEREKYAHIQGCEDSLSNWFKDRLVLLVVAVVVVIIIQIVVVIMACVLKSSIRQSSYEHI